jgi:hypothetical protein
MNMLLQMLERNFRFFHALDLKIDDRRFKTESTICETAVLFDLPRIS